MPYLLARPALRKLLHESTPTMYETGLLNRLHSQAGAAPAGALQGTEAYLHQDLPDAARADRPGARSTAGSMEEKFLQDAATAFAVLALTS
jgi:hypothetical protein